VNRVSMEDYEDVDYEIPRSPALEPLLTQLKPDLPFKATDYWSPDVDFTLFVSVVIDSTFFQC